MAPRGARKGPCALAALALLAAGCGGDGRNSDLVTQPVVLPRTTVVEGRILSITGPANPGPLEVRLLSDPAIRTSARDDGTFTLTGLAAGTATLDFAQGGENLGRITFPEVAAHQHVAIDVRVIDEEIVLVSEDRRGLGAAAVEVRGTVENLLAVNEAADSRFVLASRSIVARPGVTAVRDARNRRSVADLTLGRPARVRGSTTDAGGLDVIAFEIKLLDRLDAPADPEMTICHRPPGLPARAKTVAIRESAWPSHQSHGDREGTC